MACYVVSVLGAGKVTYHCQEFSMVQAVHQTLLLIPIPGSSLLLPGFCRWVEAGGRVSTYCCS